MSIFFTADHHLGHTNIIRYCNRPFKDVDEMNEVMLERWNSVVSDEDIIYHLGDLVFNLKGKTYLPKLKGKIHLIKGNHDWKLNSEDKKRFESIHKGFLRMEIERKRILLSHYKQTGLYVTDTDLFLYGHNHSVNKDVEKIDGVVRCNIGVDAWNFTPASWEDIREIYLQEKRK